MGIHLSNVHDTAAFDKVIVPKFQQTQRMQAIQCHDVANRALMAEGFLHGSTSVCWLKIATCSGMCICTILSCTETLHAKPVYPAGVSGMSVRCSAFSRRQSSLLHRRRSLLPYYSIYCKKPHCCTAMWLLWLDYRVTVKRWVPCTRAQHTDW